MATLTATSFRAALKTRMKIDGVEFSDAQLDEAGRAAFQAVYPALYQIVLTTSVPVVTNPNTGSGSINVSDSSRVYEIVDVNTEATLVGWLSSGSQAIRGLPQGITAVDVYSFGPYLYPETGSLVVPDAWLDTLYLYAQATLTEGVLLDKSQFRGYKANSREGMADENDLANTASLMFQQFREERDEHALSLPARVL